MKVLSIFFVVLVYVITVSAQTTRCNLTLKDAPSLRGLKFGMSGDEAVKTLALSEKPTSIKTTLHLKKEGDKYTEVSILNRDEYEKNRQQVDIGESNLIYVTKPYSPINPNLDGIRNLSLYFFKDRLYLMIIDYYSPDIKWKNIEEFVYVFSDKLNLSKDHWFIQDEFALLNCEGFSLNSHYTSENIINLFYKNKQLSEELREEARKIFIEQEKQKGIVDYEKKKNFKP